MSAQNDAVRYAIPGLPPPEVLVCSTVDCGRTALPNESLVTWQDLRERCGLLLCPDCEHVCANCCGEGHTVYGDREDPCTECGGDYYEYDDDYYRDMVDGEPTEAI